MLMKRKKLDMVMLILKEIIVDFIFGMWFIYVVLSVFFKEKYV